MIWVPLPCFLNDSTTSALLIRSLAVVRLSLIFRTSHLFCFDLLQKICFLQYSPFFTAIFHLQIQSVVILKRGTKGKAKAPQKRLDFGSRLPHFLIIMGSKKAGCPIINQEKPGQARSNPSKIGQRTTDFLERKKPGKPHGSGLFEHF